MLSTQDDLYCMINKGVMYNVYFLHNGITIFQFYKVKNLCRVAIIQQDARTKKSKFYQVMLK